MKILVYADPHWSQYSSILRARGDKYSKRLEYLIKTINFIENEAYTRDCDAIICLGDFFDKPDLNAEEITALSEINWNQNTRHIFLAGNHEMGLNNNIFNSVNALSLCPNCKIITQPDSYKFTSCSFYFLPYIDYLNRKAFNEYIDSDDENFRIVFSHNDVKGIQLGKFLSEEGFDISDINDNCDLFINGHLHNKGKISDIAINLGNITGQNFNENALEYDHNCLFFDTDTYQLEFIENPYAFNFYKLDICNLTNDLMDKKLSEIKSNAVINITTNNADPEFLQKLRDKLTNQSILNFKIHVIYNKSTEDTVNSLLDKPSINYIDRFKSFASNIYKDSDVIRAELIEVFK